MSRKSLTDTLISFIPSKRDPWWGWPLGLFGLAVFCVTAALLVYPLGNHEELWLFGMGFGGECGMKTQFGIPCPQCGMTRSWVWLVRGHFLKAFIYSPAGCLLLCWIVVGGVIGFARLIRRNPTLWSPPWTALFIWSLFWIFVPYMGLDFVRLAGVNILPEYVEGFDIDNPEAKVEPSLPTPD